MANMSYCRWENTSNDLQDCLNAFNEWVNENYEKIEEWSVPTVRQAYASSLSEDEARAFHCMMYFATELVQLGDE